MSQELFEEVIGEPPPSTVDVARIVRRERWGQRMRQAPLAAAAVLSLVIGSLYVAATFDRPSTRMAAPGFVLTVDTQESAKASGQQLSKALDRAVHQAAPGVRWVVEKNGRWVAGPPLVLTVRDLNGAKLFSGTGELVNQGRNGLLLVSVEGKPEQRHICGKTLDAKSCAQIEAASDPLVMLKCSISPDGGCKQRTGPQGQLMTVRHWRFNANADYTEVRIALPDDRALVIEVHNKALTADQLVQISGDLAGQIRR